MKRLLAAFFCLTLPLLPAGAQTTKPAAPATKPPGLPAATPAPPTDGRATGEARPGQVAVQRYTGHLSADPAQFIIDVRTMMVASNNAGAKALGEQLRQLWGSNQLTASQQATIAKLSQQMLDKKLRPIPHLTAFFSAIVGGKTKASLSDKQLDQYLDAVGQSVEKDPAADVEKYLATTARVLNGGYLYRTGFNALRMTGGQLSFAYKAAAVPDPNATFDTAPAPATPKPAAALPAATGLAAALAGALAVVLAGVFFLGVPQPSSAAGAPQPSLAAFFLGVLPIGGPQPSLALLQPSFLLALLPPLHMSPVSQPSLARFFLATGLGLGLAAAGLAAVAAGRAAAGLGAAGAGAVSKVALGSGTAAAL